MAISNADPEQLTGPKKFMRCAKSVAKGIASSSTAAWAQTIIAAVALVFAYSSVESWREQELAKRQAEIASSLTTRISSLHSVITAMWPEPQRYSDADLTAQDSVLKTIYAQPAYFLFLAQAKELKLFSSVVTGTIPNELLQLRVQDFVEQLEAIASCVQHVRNLDRDSSEAKSSSIWKSRAKSALALMPELESVQKNQNACNFEATEVFDQMEEIQKLSAKYLSLSSSTPRKSAKQ